MGVVVPLQLVLECANDLHGTSKGQSCMQFDTCAGCTPGFVATVRASVHLCVCVCESEVRVSL